MYFGPLVYRSLPKGIWKERWWIWQKCRLLFNPFVQKILCFSCFQQMRICQLTLVLVHFPTGKYDLGRVSLTLPVGLSPASLNEIFRTSISIYVHLVHLWIEGSVSKVILMQNEKSLILIFYKGNRTPKETSSLYFQREPTMFFFLSKLDFHYKN